MILMEAKIIVYAWNLPTGGLFKTITEEMKCFGKIGDAESIFYYAKIPDYYKEEFQRMKSTVICKNMKTAGIRKNIGNATATSAFSIPSNAFLKAPRAIYGKKPRVVICHELGSAFTILPFLLFRRDRVVLVLHDDPFSFLRISFFAKHFIIRKGLHLFFTLLFLVFKEIVCTTKSISDALRSFGINGNIRVADYGVNICNEDIADSMDDKVLVITKWVEYRRPDIYVEVAKILGKRCEFIIAGHWDDMFYLEKIRKMIANANSSGSNIRLIVDPSESDVHALYHQSRIFLRLSFKERGTGQGILDAIGHGIPLILGYGLGGLSEIEDGKHAIFVDSENPSSVAQQVIKLLSDRNIWNTFSSNVRILAKNYTWQKYCDALMGSHVERFLGEYKNGKSNE